MRFKIESVALPRYLKLILMFFTTLLLSTTIVAQSRLALLDEKDCIDLRSSTNYLIDPSNQIIPDSMIWGSVRKKFKPFKEFNSQKYPKAEYIWLKIELTNLSDHDILTYVEFGFAKTIDVYVLMVSKIIQTIHSGYMQTGSLNNSFTNFNNGSDILFRANPSETILLLKYKLSSFTELTPSIKSKNIIEKHRINDHLRWGLFFGMILIMFMYHFFVYLNVKDNAYLYYISYIAIVCLMFLRKAGYLNYVFSGDIYFKYILLMIVLDNLVSACYLIFSRKFIELKKISLFWDKVFLNLIRLRILIILFTIIFYLITNNSGLTIQIVSIGVLIDLIVVLFTFKTIYIKGGHKSKIFIIGSSIMTISSFAALFFMLLVPLSGIGAIILQFGIVLQIFVFSIGFGRKLQNLELT